MAVYYIGFPLMVLVAVLDSTFMPLLRIWGGMPSLLLIVTLSWAMVTDLDEALPWAVMGGILHDLLSVVPTGSSALALTLIIVVLNRTLPPVDWKNLVVPPLVVFAATFPYFLVLFVTMALADFPVPVLWGTFYIVLPGAIQNALLTPFFFRLLGAINHFLRPTREPRLLR